MEVTVENTESIQSPVASTRSEPIAHLALAQRFYLDVPSKQDEGKLAEIWALAKDTAKSENISDIIWEVVHLEGVLGAPNLGESRLDKLYKYAKLKRQEKQIQEELKSVSGSAHLYR